MMIPPVSQVQKPASATRGPDIDGAPIWSGTK
jgi:hypothetical protein